jgi:hypothetical protein
MIQQLAWVLLGWLAASCLVALIFHLVRKHDGGEEEDE